MHDKSTLTRISRTTLVKLESLQRRLKLRSMREAIDLAVNAMVEATEPNIQFIKPMEGVVKAKKKDKDSKKVQGDG